MEEEMRERTFVMIKPNAVAAGLIGMIIHLYELSRLTVVGMKIKTFSTSEAEDCYREHEGKKFFPESVEFMTSGPTVLLVLEGENAVAIARQLNGSTDPAEAAIGTIRFLLGKNKGRNIVHSSDSLESAKREISRWFSPEEIVVQQFSPDFRVE